MTKDEYTYELLGNVTNLSAPQEISPGLLFFEFGFSTPKYNGVFYIRFKKANALKLCGQVVWALVMRKKIWVIWTTDTPWDPAKDPGGFVTKIRVPRR